MTENKRTEYKLSFGKEVIISLVAFANDDRIIISNPGRLHGGLTVSALQNDGYVSSIRNRLLAEAFYLIGDIERYGTGFIRIREYLKGYPELSFNFEEQGDYFVSATMSIATYSGAITHIDIINYTIDYVYDYRGSATGSTAGDGLISLTASNIIVTGTAGVTFSYITTPGTYSVTYTIIDLAANSVSYAEQLVLNII